MYKSFFKLTSNPFDLTPDPHFLFPTRHHNEAIAGLYYGVTSGKGFMVLTGEVGTGKTLVVRCLLSRLDDVKNLITAYVFNTSLTTSEFLRLVAQELGLILPPSDKADLLFQLNALLIEQHTQQRSTVLIVDEAQNLSEAVLEEIRLLSNLETPEGKLIQIVLVGQPELDRKIETHALRQLKQRVAVRLHLEPLSVDLTRGYVLRRLKLAGSPDGNVFSPAALERVFFYSGGIPRTINILCENALITSYAMGQKYVAASVIDQVAGDLKLNPNGRPQRNSANNAIQVPPVREVKSG